MTEEKILRLVEEANPADPLKFVRNIVADYALQKMHGYMENCHDCTSCSNCSKKSLTAGPLDASVMIISEAVTTEQGNTAENLTEPLRGSQAYDYIKSVFDYLKVDADKIFWMNAVNCFVSRQEGKENIARLPTSEEVNNCKVFVDYAVDLVKPKMIILFGNVAANAFRSEPGSMNALHGSWMNVHGIPAMITYNPDELVRMAGKINDQAFKLREEDFINDLDVAFASLRQQIPDCNVFKQEQSVKLVS